MGKRSQKKGYRAENEIVRLHREMGFTDVRRVPLSGRVEGFRGDIHIGDLVAEVKCRGGGAGFVTLERWLAGNDVLFLRRDRSEPLVLLPWATWQRLLRSVMSL